MKSLKGTQTERNILTAFAGESQARNRYDYFAGAAKKDGFVQIADIFTETALQEKEHAKRLGARWDPALKKWYYEGPVSNYVPCRHHHGHGSQPVRRRCR